MNPLSPHPDSLQLHQLLPQTPATFRSINPPPPPLTTVFHWLAVIDEDSDFKANITIDYPDFVNAQLTVGALQVIISLSGVGGLDIKGHSALTVSHSLVW